MFEKIPGNVPGDSGECSRRLRGIFKKISGNVIKDSGNVPEDSGEYSSRIRGMFKEIPGNLNLNLFLEILLVFHQILLLNCYKTMRKKKKKRLLSDSSKKNPFFSLRQYDL